jgi:hypothetical protein
MINRQPGFTFIEVITAGFLLTVVVAIGAAFWYYTRQNYEFSMTQYRLTENATRAIRTMTQELREARDAMDGGYPLETLLEKEIVFYSDVNNDNQVDRVHYWVSNNILYRGVITPTGDPPTYVLTNEKRTILSEQVATSSAAIFTYYNGDWPGDLTHNPLATASRALNTRMVGVSLPLVIKDTTGNNTYSVKTTIHIRNLKDNL